MPTITLTDEQASLIVFYILLTTNFREGEIEACNELALKKKEDGTAKFPNMAMNVKWWKKTTENSKKSEGSLKTL